MALATVDETGMPDVRMVLAEGFEAGGFVFYTNLESRKGEQLGAVPKAALCFHWKSLRRQVRVRGRWSRCRRPRPTHTSSRPRLAAWAPGRASSRSRWRAVSRWRNGCALHREIAAERFLGRRIGPASHRPREIEFWRDGAFRLHDRMRFTRVGERWAKAQTLSVMEELARARQAMVERQLRARGIADERVLDAMARVPT